MTIEIEAGASQHQCSMKSLYRPSFFEHRFLDPFVVKTPFPPTLKPLLVTIRITPQKNLAQ
jgi:hypothetical protein